MLGSFLYLLVIALALMLFRAGWCGFRRRRGTGVDYLDWRGLLPLILLALVGWFLVQRFPLFVPPDQESKRLVQPGFVYAQGLVRQSADTEFRYPHVVQVKWVSFSSDAPIDAFLVHASDSIAARKILEEGGQPQSVVAQLTETQKGTIDLPGYFFLGDNYVLLFRSQKPAQVVIRYGYRNR